MWAFTASMSLEPKCVSWIVKSLYFCVIDCKQQQYPGRTQVMWPNAPRPVHTNMQYSDMSPDGSKDHKEQAFKTQNEILAVIFTTFMIWLNAVLERGGTRVCFSSFQTIPRPLICSLCDCVDLQACAVCTYKEQTQTHGPGSGWGHQWSRLQQVPRVLGVRAAAQGQRRVTAQSPCAHVQPVRRQHVFRFVPERIYSCSHYGIKSILLYSIYYLASSCITVSEVIYLCPGFITS